MYMYIYFELRSKDESVVLKWGGGGRTTARHQLPSNAKFTGGPDRAFAFSLDFCE